MGLVDGHSHQWPSALHALEHRQFRWLWMATFVSNCGSWMQKIAIGWLIFTTGGSTVWLGVDAALSGLPALILLPIGGVLADRIDRRKVLICTNLLSSLVSLGLAVLWWKGLLTTWHLLAASFVAGAASAVAAPANQSIVPSIAGEDHLPNAVRLNSFQYNVARAAGPAIGGVMFAWLGAGGCFLLNAVSFVGLIVIFVLTPGKFPSGKRSSSAPTSFSAGFRYAWSTPHLRHLLSWVAILAFGGAPVVTLLPAAAKQLERGADAYAVLLSSFGIGAALVGIGLTFLPARIGAFTWVIAGAGVVGLCQILLASTQSLFLAMMLCAVAGAAFVGSMIEIGSSLLADTPDEFRGRISSLQQLCFRTFQPLGGLVAATWASHSNVQFPLAGLGIFILTMSSIGIALSGMPKNRSRDLSKNEN